MPRKRPLLTIPRLTVASFALAIVAGTLLLLIPACRAPGTAALGVVDALFTSTSAVCVTGLVVRDTGSCFSHFGQVVILALIQAGGLGIITLSSALLMLTRTGHSVRERMVLEEAVAGGREMVSPRQFMLHILAFTFICEGLGAAALTLRFMRDFPAGEALWLGVFHAVSAFCNAGFGLFPDSLVRYAGDWVVNLVVMGLIIMGGIGFLVVSESVSFLRHRRHRRVRLSLHARVVFATTLLLVLGGGALIFLLEFPSKGVGGPWHSKILASLFMSVTARTAGFNTVGTPQFSNPTLLVVMLLMVVGGSPGGTAGGVKTTTLAALHALIVSRARNRSKVELMGRSLPPEVMAKALFTAAAYGAAIVAGTLLLQVIEQGATPHAQVGSLFLPHLFEVVSALGTVGLSIETTATLTDPSKVVIIVCMLAGRVGPLLLASSLVGSAQRIDYAYPEERIMIG